MSHSPHCERGRDAAIRAIRSQTELIGAQAAAVDDLDRDAIHDMRVASRRLRMALDTYRPYLPGKPRKRLRNLARSITRNLGVRRELDVMASMLRAHRNETHGVWQRFMDHAIFVIDVRREAQAPYCHSAVACALGEEFRAATEAVAEGVDATGICLHELAQAGLLGALEEARAARSAWKRTGDPEALHLVRIALKHLRYACEFHAPLYGEAMVIQIATIKSAQELLGEWNECRLLEDMLEALGGAAEYSLALGAPLVAEAYGQHAEELAAQFKPIGRALLGKKARGAFESLVASPEMVCCGDDHVAEDPTEE